MSDQPAPTTPAPTTEKPAAPSVLFGGDPAATQSTPQQQPAAGSPPPTNGQQPASPAASAESSDPWAKWSPEKKGFFENKGWLKDGKFDVDAATEAYQQLEKFRGMPADEAFRISKKATPEELARVHKRLGVPDNPEGYGLKAEPGQDPTVLTEIAKTALEVKATPEQVQGFLKLNQALFEKQETERKRAADELFQKDGAALAREWGLELAKNKSVAQRASNLEAFRSEGLDEGFWEHAASYPGVGPAKIARALYKLGLGLGEDKYVTGQPTTGGERTVESAEARVREIQKNEALRKRYLGKDPDLVREMESLQKVIANGRKE